MGMMGRGVGLFLYLSKINYDCMSGGKINYASFYVSLKGTMQAGKMTTKIIIVR